MRIICFLSFLLLTFRLQAQNTDLPDTRIPFKEGDSVYVEAGFPGGNGEWIKFLEHNLHSETAAAHNAPPGRYIVTASFAIDTAGNVINAQIAHDPGYGTGDDVIRVLNKSPKWWPATINDKPVIYRQKQNFYYSVVE